MRSPLLSKRHFLKQTALSACAVAAFPSLVQAAKAKIPVGLQLYSVRDDCQKDLVKTISAVSKMGYKGVEFAGYYGRDARTLRQLLDDNGLKCCGTHIGLDTLLGDKLAQTVEFNRTLGNPYLIVPGLDDKYHSSRKAWRETADIFNDIAGKLKPHGMRVGYHNHTIEFAPMDGEMPWDTFFGNTKKEVIMQFDTGNAMEGGGDATVFLKKYPGRAATVHVKPHSKAKPNALMGEDELPWTQIFKLCEGKAKTEWYIVEYESDAYPPLVSVEKTLDVLRKWGKL